MNIIARTKFAAITLGIGDSICFTFSKFGKIIHEETIVADKCITVDEDIVFTTFFEDRQAYGAMIVEQKK